MKRVLRELIIATRLYTTDGTYEPNIVRVCMQTDDRSGQLIWEMSDEAARKLRDQLTEVIG